MVHQPEGGRGAWAAGEVVQERLGHSSILMTMDIPIALKDLLGAAALTDVGVLPVGKVILHQKWIAFDASRWHSAGLSAPLSWRSLLLACPGPGLHSTSAPTRCSPSVKRRCRGPNIRHRGCKHGTTWISRQHRMAGARRLVTRAGASDHRDYPRGHHHRHPVRLGAVEARRDGALAYRQNDRARRRRVAPVPTPTLR